MKEDVFEKAERFYNVVQKEFDISKGEIGDSVSRIATGLHNKSSRKGTIIKQDVVIYEILLKHKFNPNTVYRWFLVTTSPKEIVTKLKSGELSIREALHHRNKMRKQFSTNDSDFIKEVIWYVEEYVLWKTKNF